MTTEQFRRLYKYVNAIYSGDYIFIKTQKFDAVGFQKALASAKTTAKDYNEGVDRWLRRNAKKYGFKYEFKKA